MNKALKLRVLVLALASLTVFPALAADPPPPPPAGGGVYGAQLMTPQERRAFRIKMRTAKSPEERATIRAEHHAAMQARAKEKGVTLPDAPPARGGGMGPGMGGGMGPGMGGGMGPGMGGTTATPK